MHHFICVIDGVKRDEAYEGKLYVTLIRSNKKGDKEFKTRDKILR